MPIYLEIQPRMDDRAARQVSDQAKKHFTDAGKNAGQDFSKALSAGLTSSDAAVRKSAENTEKAYKRAADAAGAVRVEEAKLEDMRTKGSGATAMLTQTEKLEKARRAEVSTSRTAVTALRDLDTAQRGAAESGSVLSNLLSGMASGAAGTRIGGMASSAESLAAKLGSISPVALGATAGIAALGVGVVTAGKQLYDLGAQWDALSDNITGRTGIMGDQLNVIVDSVKQVGTQSAISFEAISQYAGGVAQTLHLTGDEAQLMTQKLADIQQVTNQVVDTRGLGKAFRLFDITDVNTEIQVLQELVAASQSAQVPINDLLTTLSNTGKASKDAGLDLQQTLGLILALEDAGVSFEKAGPALTIAMKNWAKDGRDANVALAETVKQIKTLIDAGNEPGARQLASQTFGKGYIDFFDAIKDRKLDAESLIEVLQKLGATGDLIGDQKKATEDASEGWEKLKHSAQSFLQPLADWLFSSANQPLLQMQDNIDGADTKLQGLASTINSLKPDALANALGLPALPGAPAAPKGPPLPFVGPNQPGGGTTPGPQSNTFYSDWYPKTTDTAKKGLPQAPGVPYDQTLPPGFAQVPQTAEILGAENSWMDARHTLAEKRARLDQLEKDANATEDDKIKARNDIVNAEQAQQQAELRLYDARQSLYDKDAKLLNKHATDLGEIGAKLDADFGISKGLAGIAENLTKFLANLAAAPLEGKLQAIVDADPHKGGYGLMGILGAQGVFGPNFTGLDDSTQSATSPQSVLAPNGQVSSYTPPGTAQPGESARDFAHRVMMPFWESQGFQVGDHAADQYGEHQHGAIDIMVPNIAAGNQVLQQVLSDPNVYGAIFNNQTYGYGHGTTPQDYTAGHTGNPTLDHQDHVHAWYKPGDPNDINPTGAGPTAAPGAPGGYQQTGSTPFGSIPIPLPVTIVGGMPGAPPGTPAPGQGFGPPPGPTAASAGIPGPGSGGGAESWRNTVAGVVDQYGPQMGITQANRQKWIDAITSQIGTESQGNPGADNPNDSNGSGGTQHVSGLLQYLPQSYAASGGKLTGLPYMDPIGQIAGALFAPRNADGSPSTTAPGSIGAGHGWGPTAYSPSGVPNIIPGSAGQGFLGLGGPGLSPAPGLGGGQPGVGSAFGQGLNPAPGVGGGAGTQIGAAVAPPTGQGGGIGVSGGLMEAGMMAAGGLDLLAPGAGQAAQTAMKLANRAIQFGSQVAGISAQGWMETLLPTGGSQLASNSWLTKIVGGIAGAHPTLPNTAGAKTPQGQQPGQGQPGQGPPQNTTNINVTNQRATEDGTGKDIAWHAQQSMLPPGKP